MSALIPAGRPREALSVATVAIAVAVGVLAPDPDRYLRSALRFHDYLHVPGLVAITAVLFWGFPLRSHASNRRLLHCCCIVVASIAVGVLVEVLQAVAGGTVDASDIARDAAGALATGFTAASTWPDVRSSRRAVMRLAAAVLVTAFAWPAVDALIAEWRARRQFPVLADFSRGDELDRFEWSPAARVSRVCASGVVPRCAARVSLSPGEYPGLALVYFPRDWRGFRLFVLSCTNESREPLQVGIRIDDMGHNEQYSDRFNRAFVLSPGDNEIRIPLGQIEHAPRGRRLDVSRVRQVVIFAHRLTSRHDIVVESLRLEP